MIYVARDVELLLEVFTPSCHNSLAIREETDECASDPCQNWGTCHDEINAFSCSCPSNLFTGSMCETPIIYKHYQYGQSQGDISIHSNLYCDDIGKTCASDFIQIPNVQISTGQFKRLKIYTNGYVTFGMTFDSRYPNQLGKDMLNVTKRITARKRGFAMLAPLWTDNDGRSGDVFYHIYDTTKPGSAAIDKARVKTNTFQLIIAYDPSRYQTYVMHIYLDMGWNNEYIKRRSMIGYVSLKSAEEKSLQLAPSMKSTAFRLHSRLGNIGELGRYMFKVAAGKQDVNYDQKCLSWFANEMKRISLVQYYWGSTLICPCDLRLALMDVRWRFDWKQFYETNYERRCIYESATCGQSTQECCYSPSGSLVNTEDGRGGQTFFYHPHSSTLHHKYDVLPKQWCCYLTDNCDSFYHVRPMDHCIGYMPLLIGWFYGDPHIRTLDGFEYTFNGLGEYTLIETRHGEFTLQGRTAKVRDENGQETDATVFSAFAARDRDSDTVHVEMTTSRRGLAILVENENVTDWFTSANTADFQEYICVSVTKTNSTQIEISYATGFSLTIGVKAEQLDVTVGAPSTFKGFTKGLMGVFNDDPTDDLLPPGENAVPLSNRSSEKTIFKEFGERWRIAKIDSMFYYAPGESYATFAHTTFTPRFLEDVLANMTPSQREMAQQKCGNNKESNASPNITADVVFNVTVGEANSLTLTTDDLDGDIVNVALESMLPDGATFDNNVYTWTPTSMDVVNISCLFDLLANGYELKQTFRIVQCNCSTGWEGDHCESDFDGCQDSPCTEGTNCTDVSPSEHIASGKAFNCSECPPGTEESAGICLREHNTIIINVDYFWT
ncbi:hypothetical protein NP493_1565g00035 [Ridgeia piscesae]|uniref:Mucin-like protein n=1 Tax=Ridgeia piscesae TaxID=27915 RepID=A0AAD9JYA8_RIDPI|nr:hypothetical protein NP493_1565g00035 [Ridgeia piscesae]